MNDDTLENIISKMLKFDSCTFSFQGGEPLLAGLDFYKKYIELVNKYNTNNNEVYSSIQTNGILIDEKWCKFFKDNNFLVGLSIDGPELLHDSCRVYGNDNGTYSDVIKAKKLLDEYEVEYNVLCVVTKYTYDKAKDIFEYLCDNGVYFHQYIPCMDYINGGSEYALDSKEYGIFLNDLFDVWYENICKGKEVSVRFFENVAGILLGYYPESCGMSGNCTNQFVIEANGNVYPCDFYCLDEYLLGNINEDSIEKINRRIDETDFISSSRIHHEDCLNCEYYHLCNDGCKRDRVDNKSKYCEAYKSFYKHSLPILKAMLKTAN